jgi:cysteine synthase
MSSGGIVWAALELARQLGPGKRIATVAPDSGARYLTTALFSDDFTN